MRNPLIAQYTLVLCLLSLSFHSFSQFGEKQVIHEDKGDKKSYNFVGAFDFDNDNIDELWYLKNPTSINGENIFSN